MRGCGWLVLLVSADAFADDAITFRMRRLAETEPGEPLLHLDATTPLSVDAEGGIRDGQTTVIEFGRLRLAGEGTWWQSGLAPSAFAEDLQTNGWRAAGELSLDLGFVRVGANTSYERVEKKTHRTSGVFVSKGFRLSRWMKAWIQLGIAREQWDYPGQPSERGTTAGISIGTTFR